MKLNNKNTTFEKWMQTVSRFLETMFGVSADDLPDCCYRDWFDSGIDAKAAARLAFNNALEF